MEEIETMEEMLARLGQSGAAEQAKAVIKSIKLINQASGMLDSANRAIALYHLSAALAGESHAVSTLIDTADWLQDAQ